MVETKFFNDGDAYEKMMGCWSRVAGKVFLDWLALPRGLTWIDVGCGTGAFTELVVERCGPKQVFALDPAEDQIAYARKRPAAKQVDYRVGDAMTLPYADAEFDVGTMALVITFVPEPAKALAELARVVKPAGTVAIYIWDFYGKGYTQRPLRETLEAMGVDVPMMPGNVNSQIERLQDLFSAAGLEQVTTHKIEIEVSYMDFDEYWASQTALANFVVQPIRKMSCSDIERLKERLRNMLPTDRNGRIAYPAHANAIRGRVPARHFPPSG